MRPSLDPRLTQTYSTNSIQSSLKQQGLTQSQRKSKVNRKSISFYSSILCLLYIKKIKKSIKRRKHREKVLQQWYNTQWSYNMNLNTTLNHIKKPMEVLGIIDKDQSQILFPGIDGMIQLSNMMINIIEQCRKIKNPNKIMLGQELKKVSDGYKLYRDYFGGHSKSSKLLAQLSETKEDKMKEVEEKMQAQIAKKQPKKENMTIKDCMQQPLYRLFKYVLLLKQYTKKLPIYHKDYETILACHKSFHQVNNSNNELMKKKEDEQKKIKLDKLFGEALKENRTLISQMQASTLDNNVKLYIFNDIIIISKIESWLGSEKQQKYGTFQLNQFCYVAEQENLKYFKNILILITKEECIHLFFPDQGSRLQFFKSMQKIFRQLRIKEHERRKLEDSQKNAKIKKITFTLQQKQVNSSYLLQPQFRVQILGVQIRPLTAISNETVYITRIMMPQYYLDELNFLNSEGFLDKNHSNRDSVAISKQNANIVAKYLYLPFNVDHSLQDTQNSKSSRQTTTHKCISQKIEIHFSALQQIYKQMVTICPDKVPDIDPITKDVNIYAKGKRKTKSFEVRKFFIEQFFNFIFRHEIIMANPIWFISKLRINQDIWNYSTQRNTCMKKNLKEAEKSFDYEHCAICKKAKINSLEQFEHYRNFYLNKASHRSNKDTERYCFNFFNLVRIRILSFSYLSFNTLERILLFYHFLEGRIDYPFIQHRSNDKIVKKMKVHHPSLEENFVEIIIDSKSTVGQVLEQLGNMYKMKNSFDFELVSNYKGKRRILDRDQFIYDVINCLGIECEQFSADKKQVIETERGGFFDTLKSWKNQIFSSSEEDNRIYFMKCTYLHRSLQIKSFAFSPQKTMLEVDKIFWLIKRGLIKLTFEQYTQISAWYYCLKQLDNIQYFSMGKLSTKILQRICPIEHEAVLNNQKYKSSVGQLIQGHKIKLLKNSKNTSEIHQKIIEKITNKIGYITYFLEVQPKEIPERIGQLNQLPASIFIGVNYNSLIVTKSLSDTTPIISMPIQDIDLYISVFSIFITHEKESFRFDSKMLYHFGELFKKYQLIAKRFPQ